ncbi:hypothetical protein D1872_299040 [compost metagenome]
MQLATADDIAVRRFIAVLRVGVEIGPVNSDNGFTALGDAAEALNPPLPVAGHHDVQVYIRMRQRNRDHLHGEIFVPDLEGFAGADDRRRLAG